MADLALVGVGLLGLWAGTELAVRSAGQIGRRLGLSEMFLGLTVFAVGTDIAELFVAIQGALRMLQGLETSGLVVGNALGSVLAQGGVVLGVVAFFGGVARPSPDAGRAERPQQDAAVWLGAVVVLAAAAADGTIVRWEGTLLALGYLVYLGLLIRANRAIDKLWSNGQDRRFLLPILRLVFGLALVVFAADLVVEHGMRLAERSGIDPTAIGLFALGAGTSLPELAVSIGALARGRAALSLGNVLGSNTFDLLMPLGVGAAIHPIEFGRASLLFDMPANAILALYFVVRLVRGDGLGMRDGLTLFGLYVGFTLFRLGTLAG